MYTKLLIITNALCSIDIILIVLCDVHNIFLFDVAGEKIKSRLRKAAKLVVGNLYSRVDNTCSGAICGMASNRNTRRKVGTQSSSLFWKIKMRGGGWESWEISDISFLTCR